MPDGRKVARWRAVRPARRTIVAGDFNRRFREPESSVFRPVGELGSRRSSGPQKTQELPSGVETPGNDRAPCRAKADGLPAKADGMPGERRSSARRRLIDALLVYRRLQFPTANLTPTLTIETTRAGRANRSASPREQTFVERLDLLHHSPMIEPFEAPFPARDSVLSSRQVVRRQIDNRVRECRIFSQSNQTPG